MKSNLFRINIVIDTKLRENMEILGAVYPHFSKNKTELMRLAFDLAAKYVIEKQFEALAKAQNINASEEDRDIMLSQITIE